MIAAPICFSAPALDHFPDVAEFQHDPYNEHVRREDWRHPILTTCGTRLENASHALAELEEFANGLSASSMR